MEGESSVAVRGRRGKGGVGRTRTRLTLKKLDQRRTARALDLLLREAGLARAARV